ncbi:MAG TPA: KEOPS complex subunit Cgi121, partial [Candidatus Nitrosopolaris sp.]|nr:KEOPS complex subunit Cgi121 [Candidatus Nitrosopolaris sp.]
MNPQYRTHKLGDNFVMVIGVSKFDVAKEWELVKELHAASNGAVSIQAVRADAVFGIDHILEVLKISLEAEKRNIKLVSRTEMDLLLRVSCTNQLSKALIDAGLTNRTPGCFILFSRDRTMLMKVAEHICGLDVKVDNSALKPTKRKQELICKYLGVRLNKNLSPYPSFT